ncbi:MAG: FkbM family methyltransferase [Reyranellaceae bacterium]
MLQRSLAAISRRLPPRLGLPIEVARSWHSSPELKLVAKLCQRNRGAIDVGANAGLFCWVMACHAAWCHAFEPNPAHLSWLQKGIPQAVIHTCALADRHGTAILRVPVVGGVEYTGYGSLASTQALSRYPRREISVELRTLDSFSLGDVGFVKIDVEGYEEPVLFGAANTIRSSHPVLMIELEERHNPGGRNRVAMFLRDLGYDSGNPVIGAENNFIFRPLK